MKIRPVGADFVIQMGTKTDRHVEMISPFRNTASMDPRLRARQKTRISNDIIGELFYLIISVRVPTSIATLDDLCIARTHSDWFGSASFRQSQRK